MREFSSHNIGLRGGSQTAPGLPLVQDSAAYRASERTLMEYFPWDREGITVADLGCLEGGYTALFALLGFDVTVIDARQENYEIALWLAGHFPGGYNLP